MQVTKETVLEWLNEQRRGQGWLAEQCGVTVQAVSNWLRDKNSRSISSSAQLVIGRLMREDQAMNQPASQNLVLQFSQEVFDSICLAAQKSHQLPREWAQDQLCEISKVDVESVAKAIKYSMQEFPQSKVAEDTTEFSTGKTA